MMAPRLTGPFMRALLVFAALLGSTCTQKAPEYPVVQEQDGRVAIRLSIIDDGGVHHFTYKHDDKNINFFIRTDVTGKLQAHFDACYSCFKYKLGYVREGPQVVCIACRIGYDLVDEVWDYIGACAPISLRSKVVGEALVIERKHLEAGQKYF
ncbi:MAG: hypothetical protein VR64_22060 [Desulfatitalea sp. BRH_c12]|nr:MAG: hypothetical protein VR64_22060 [Desulfatitalea sp. BRH_c12]